MIALITLLYFYIPICIIYALILLFLYLKKKFTWSHLLLATSAYIYVLLAVSITLFPIPIDSRIVEGRMEDNLIHSNNFIPFYGIYKTLTLGGIGLALYNTIGNLLLFVPLGFYLPLIFRKINSVGRIALAGLFFSLLIELMQFSISTSIGYTYRITDVDDLILNTLGNLLGFMLLKVCSPLLRQYVIA